MDTSARPPNGPTPPGDGPGVGASNREEPAPQANRAPRSRVDSTASLLASDVVELDQLRAIFLRNRARILRKLAILGSSPIHARVPRPASFGLQELVRSGRLEHRGDEVAWATEVLRRDLDSRETSIGALEQGWFSLEELELPALDAAPAGLSGLAVAPATEPEEVSEASRWFDRCVATLEPFEQDFLLCREYDGGSWEHVSALMHRSVPACKRFHAGARESLRHLVRLHAARGREPS